MRLADRGFLQYATLLGILTFFTTSSVALEAGVMDRARPAYDAKGIKMGGFRLFPQIDLGIAYDDNVFRLPDAHSDWYFREAPAVRLRSQWGRHFLEFYGGLNHYDYGRFSSLNLTDWNMGAGGRYDVTYGSAIAVAASYGNYHEPLYSPNTVGNQEAPNQYHKAHTNISASYRPNRLGFDGGASIDQLTFGNTPKVGGGFINNADRDETEYQAYARTSYDFSPGYFAFLKAGYDERVFDQELDRSGFHRASTGYRVNAGVDMQISHLVQGEFFLGYLEQHFDKSGVLQLKNISGLDFGGKVDWFASERTTVHLTAARSVSDTIIKNVSASDDRDIKLSG
jgi:hypothetical protein